MHSGHLRSLRADVIPFYASRERAKADDYCRRFNGRGSYGDYDAAIDDPSIDAVVIAVPPRFHLDLALRALAAGKHVLVEKPAFLTMADYERVRTARDRARRVVLVGENDHYKPLAVLLRELVADGVIGEMVFAHFMTLARRLKTADDWRNDETMAGGDAFFEEGIHWLHLAGSLGPRIIDIRGYRPSVSRTGPDTRAKSMMVAFRYNNDAVGTLYYSREIPSLLRGLRISKLLGRAGVISFESNGLFILVRGGGLPRLVIPGFRDMRGYRAMYRDFVRAIRENRMPQMSLERAMEDHQLMEQAYSSAAQPAPACGAGTVMRQERYDIVVIGSGAGGGTLAHALSQTSARILIVERGGFIPQEEENWDPEAVWKHLRYQTREIWLDANGREFPPYSHYNVGGNSKFWGSVLYRLRREDFQDLKHLDGLSPAWPIDYDTLEPYYDRAERLYQVHGEAGSDPTDPRRAPLPIRADSALDGDGGHRGPAPILRPASIAAAARTPRRLHALQYLQFLRVQGAREERSRRLLRPAGDAATNGHAVDQCDGHPAADEPVRRSRRGRRSRPARRNRPRRSAPVRRVVRSRQLGGAVAAVGKRRASRRTGQFVGVRRAPIHGAPRHDDAGLPPLPGQQHGLPEDRRHQRLLPAWSRRRLPARPDSVPGAHSRGDGANGRPLDSALGVSGVGVPRRRLARDVRGSSRS